MNYLRTKRYEDQAFDAALSYVINKFKLRIDHERIMTFTESAIWYANPNDFCRFKDVNSLQLSMWELTVEYRINRSLLLNDCNVDYKTVGLLDDNFRKEKIILLRRIQHTGRTKTILN